MNFLDAFQNAYEVPSSGGVVPNTTREILDCARRWHGGSDEGQALLTGVRAMAAKASRNRSATLEDLQGTPDMDPELREPLERSYDAFGVVVEALAGLEDAILADDREAAPALVESLEAGGRELTAQSQVMRAWLETPIPRCPRCGGRGEGLWCPGCGLDLLIPDPKHAQDRSIKTANLPPAYVGVFRAYTAVVSGEAPLQAMLEALDVLEAGLRTNRNQAQVYGRHVGSQKADELHDVLEDVLQGVYRMRNVLHTRAMRDLHEGWEQVFTAGSGVQKATALLLEEAGREAGHLHAADRTTDVVEFEGE